MRRSTILSLPLVSIPWTHQSKNSLFFPLRCFGGFRPQFSKLFAINLEPIYFTFYLVTVCGTIYFQCSYLDIFLTFVRTVGANPSGGTGAP
jgi:hypothetical protein